jgi:formylmethanofuran dehydrogenase subunit E
MMVDTAIRELGATPYLHVVTETVVCLPDSVQLLTPCTVGNGLLKVLDWGKFALTSYDGKTLRGVRIWLNRDSLTAYPLIQRWYEKFAHSNDKPLFEHLTAEILDAGQEIFTYRPIRLHRAFERPEDLPTSPCPTCGESYVLHFGSKCPACQNQAYYLFSDL